MTTSHDFGELRSLLAVTPSARAFDATLDFIEAALPTLGEGVYLDQWAPYLEGQLQRWPDTTRRVRKERLRALEQAPTVWSPLVRTLEYATETISERRCAAICEAEHLAGVTNLDLRGATTSYKVLHQLAEGAPFVLDAFALRKSTSSGAKPADLIPLFTSRMLSELSSLELSGWARFGASSIKAMLAHLPLGGLKTLDFHGTGLGKSGMKALLTCEELSGLERLDLGELEFGAKQLEALVDATHLTRLKHLGLARTSVSLTRIGDIAAAPHLLALESLDLRQNRLSVADVQVLCAPEAYPNLRELELEDDLSAESLEILLAAECFPVVTSLTIGKARVHASSIASASAWPSLTRLRLEDCVCDPHAWRELMGSPMCSGLEALEVDGLVSAELREHSRSLMLDVQHEHTHGFMVELLSVPIPATIERLALPLNKLTTEHIELVLAQECAPNLRSLDVSTTTYRYKEPFAGEIRLLGRTPSLANLRELSLHIQSGDEEALEELVCSEHLTNLQVLRINAYVSDTLSERLRALARPHLRVLGRYDEND